MTTVQCMHRSYFTARPVYSNVCVDNFLIMILIYRYRITRKFKKNFIQNTVQQHCLYLRYWFSKIFKLVVEKMKQNVFACFYTVKSNFFIFLVYKFKTILINSRIPFSKPFQTSGILTWLLTESQTLSWKLFIKTTQG